MQEGKHHERQQGFTVKPGKPIRYPVEAKGRFQPVEINKWIDENTINVPALHQMDDTGAAKLLQKH